jgi:MFS transporter, DHA1 family, inner membrane transport protein
MPAAPSDSPDQRLTAAQWTLLSILAAVQVTHIVDFMLLIPLETYLEEDLDISLLAYGVLIAAYGFSAALCGLLVASLLDRFDRKTSLLFLYAGFTGGTALCAFAPDYWTLLLGRILAGGCGGVVAAVVLAIVGDAFPPSRRGTAMGVVMSGFSLASVAGVPAGLLLAESSPWGWRAPFAVLAVASVAIFVFAWLAMPPVRGHLGGSHGPAALWDIATRPAHLRAYLLMLLLVFSTFMVVPYLPAFLVKNVGISKSRLYLVYLTGGAVTLFSMNLFGRLSDRCPRVLVFRALAAVAMLTILALTNLPRDSSLVVVLGVTTALMIFTSGRMVPGMAIITSVAAPRDRGSFLSVNSSVQQFAAGLAALVSLLFMGDTKGKEAIVGFPLVGLLACVAGVLSLVVIGGLRAAPGEAVHTPELEFVAGAEAIETTGATGVAIPPPTDFSEVRA